KSQRLSNSNEDVSFGNQNEQVDDDDDEVYLRIRRSPKGGRGGGDRSSGGRSGRSGTGHSVISTGRTSVGRRAHFQSYVRSLPSYPNIKRRSVSSQFVNHRIVNPANVHRTSTNLRRINSRINNHRRLPNIPNRSNFRRRISSRLPNTNTRGRLNHPNYRDVEKKRSNISAGAIAGIVLGSLAGVLLIILGVFCCYRKRLLCFSA
uniref:Uncharacterized protein n=1 Tax=Clytia hemisphaerica TaxID=252671 RepID=A0A7M5XCC8_9CNID